MSSTHSSSTGRGRRPARAPSNAEIAEMLERIADLLEVQDAGPHRLRAYRNAARLVRARPDPVAAIAEEGGPEGLEQLPGIGRSLARTIAEFVRSGRVVFLDRLEGQVSPADLFATVPGIGDELAHRIESVLGIETLEDLEAAAVDGRLQTVPGFGPRRVRGIREALGHLLRFASQRRRRRWQQIGLDGTREEPPAEERPPVELLLALDREYREQARRGELRKITPRRFNPERRAWLPILHVERAGWSLTALFSNTARAHELGRTDDWVVVYYERDGLEGQCTIVTERSGPVQGRRVVRGREAESMAASSVETEGRTRVSSS